jgi:hypothetical protein
MGDVCSLIWLGLVGLFRSRASLQAEILTLRHQLNVLRRQSSQRLTFSSIDRLVLTGLYQLAPGVLDALKIVRPETVIRWHRAGFRAYWRWKSKPQGGRPKTPVEIRHLIGEMSLANPLWGAPWLRRLRPCGLVQMVTRVAGPNLELLRRTNEQTLTAALANWPFEVASCTASPYIEPNVPGAIQVKSKSRSTRQAYRQASFQW